MSDKSGVSRKMGAGRYPALLLASHATDREAKITLVMSRRIDGVWPEIEAVCLGCRSRSRIPGVDTTTRAIIVGARYDVATAHKVEGRGSYIVITEYSKVSSAPVVSYVNNR